MVNHSSTHHHIVLDSPDVLLGRNAHVSLYDAVAAVAAVSVAI